MNANTLHELSYKKLKELAKSLDVPIKRKKDDMVEDLLELFSNYEEHVKTHKNKFEIVSKIGVGKEGTTYKVKKSKFGKKLAMKTFRKNKSSTTLQREVELQNMAASIGVSPKVIEHDVLSKYIVMDLLDGHLVEFMKKQNGNLKHQHQTQIVNIMRSLDKVGVFHGDSNLLNFMYCNKKLYVIDFGMSKRIDTNLILKLGTSTPNYDIGILGIILKLRELGCPKSSYSHLKKCIAPSELKRFDL